MKCFTYYCVYGALACLLIADGLGAQGPDSSTLASARWTQFRGPNASGTSPILAGDILLLNREQQEDPHLLAVDKVIDGNRLLVATFQTLGEPALRVELPTFEELKEHDADGNGTISFKEFPEKYKLFDRPEVSDEKGVSMRLKSVLGMVDTEQDREITSEEWEGFGQRFAGYVKDHGLLSIEFGGEGNVTETHVRILGKKNLPEVPSPLVHQGRIYMIKNGGIITCLDSTSGEKLYRKRISASGSYYASPIAVGDHIYLTSRQGVVTVLRASDTLDVLAENDLSEKIMATPAVADNTLYLRTGSHLYAFH